MIFGNSRTIKMINYSKSSPTHIFKGAKGLGKGRIAKALARHYLCKTKEPNCSCTSCNKLKSGNHPDFSYLGLKDGEKSIKVEDVLPVVNEAFSRPLESEYKVMIIDDADYMTVEAQNKLLKTIEDIPKYMKLILVSHGPLLATIESRCIVHVFSPLEKSDMNSFIQTITTDKFETEMLVLLSAGSPGTAKKLLSTDTIKYLKATVDSLYSDSCTELLNKLGLLKEKDNKNIVSVLEENLYSYLCGLKQIFFGALMIKLHTPDTSLSNINEQLQLIADSNERVKLSKIIEDIDKCIEDYYNNKFSQESLLFFFYFCYEN